MMWMGSQDDYRGEDPSSLHRQHPRTEAKVTVAISRWSSAASFRTDESDGACHQIKNLWHDGVVHRDDAGWELSSCREPRLVPPTVGGEAWSPWGVPSRMTRRATAVEEVARGPGPQPPTIFSRVTASGERNGRVCQLDAAHQGVLHHAAMLHLLPVHRPWPFKAQEEADIRGSRRRHVLPVGYSGGGGLRDLCAGLRWMFPGLLLLLGKTLVEENNSGAGLHCSTCSFSSSCFCRTTCSTRSTRSTSSYLAQTSGALVDVSGRADP